MKARAYWEEKLPARSYCPVCETLVLDHRRDHIGCMKVLQLDRIASALETLTEGYGISPEGYGAVRVKK